MTRTIQISVKDRIAWQTNGEEYICGNSDFVVHFAFDDEWESIEMKTARFVYGEQFTDVVFSGDICNIPVIADTHKMKVGVYAGNLRTTTAATVRCKKCILSGGGMVADPVPDVYAQIIEKLNKAKGVSWNDLEDKPFYEKTYTVTNQVMLPAVIPTPQFGGEAKVSDMVVPRSSIVGLVMDSEYGSATMTQEIFNQFMEDGHITDDIAFLEYFTIVYTPGAEFDGVVYPEAGIYAYPSENRSSITWKQPVTIDPKFLPERVKKVYIHDDGSGNYTASETYDQIEMFVRDGFDVNVYLENYVMRLSVHNARGDYSSGYFVFYSIGKYCAITTVIIYDNGDVRRYNYGGIPM